MQTPEPPRSWTGPGWQDRLVELQVLSAQGDHGAAELAATWLAHDERASHMWNSIARDCDRIRADVEPSTDP